MLEAWHGACTVRVRVVVEGVPVLVDEEDLALAAAGAHEAEERLPVAQWLGQVFVGDC